MTDGAHQADHTAEDTGWKPAPIRTDVERLRDLTERLADVVTRECAALETRQFGQLKALIEEKVLLARSYEEMSAQLGDEVEKLDPVVQDVLRPATRRLRQILERHSVLAAGARTVAERLIRSFGEAVTRELRPVLSYGPKASLKTATAAPSSIAFNANA